VTLAARGRGGVGYDRTVTPELQHHLIFLRYPAAARLDE
jgi:hypothetical protein